MIWTTRQRSEFGPLKAITEGAGPKVVLLHGVGLRAEAWAAQIDALVAAGFAVVAPDMLGHGHSTAAPDNASLADFVTPLAGLLDQPALVVGHSMGAMMALELAAQCPDLVRGVVAMNAVFQRSEQARSAVMARASVLDGATVADPAGTLQRWFGSQETEESTACRQWLTEVDPAGYKAAYTVFANSDGPGSGLLQGLDCPALFLTGADEPNSTPEMSRSMAALTPQGRAKIIEGAAHMMPMTHISRVNSELLDFAKECLS